MRKGCGLTGAGDVACLATARGTGEPPTIAAATGQGLGLLYERRRRARGARASGIRGSWHPAAREDFETSGWLLLAGFNEEELGPWLVLICTRRTGYA